jgi:hypothetical protein
MPDPFPFPAVTATLGLPLLVPGQAQKEFFLNEALSILDAVYAHGIDGSLPAPPANAPDGASYRVTAPATDAWQGRADQLALRIGGAWHFVAPREGMSVFDRSAGQLLVFRTTWQSAAAPEAPTGGSVVDAEARAAITQVLQALQALGILA